VMRLASGVINMENSEGPRTEPCGTPSVMGVIGDVASPILTKQDLSVR